MMVKSSLAPLAFLAIAVSGCSSPARVSLGHGELTGIGGNAGSGSSTKPNAGKSSSDESASDAGTSNSGQSNPPPATTETPPPPAAGTAAVDAARATNCAAIPSSSNVDDADAYVMLDQSSSMAEPYAVPSIGSWWDATGQAFALVVGDPAFAGLAMGLQYFPLGGVAPDSCSGHYETPDIELAPLPGNAGALNTSIAAHSTNGFTPTGPALIGAVRHMKEWAAAHPGRRPFVLFVTDGFPTECVPQDIDAVAAVAREARDTVPPIRVGVIGLNLGAGGANLDAIAKAGGTTSARLINDGDPGAALKSAIQSILTSPVSCD